MFPTFSQSKKRPFCGDVYSSLSRYAISVHTIFFGGFIEQQSFVNRKHPFIDCSVHNQPAFSVWLVSTLLFPLVIEFESLLHVIFVLCTLWQDIVTIFRSMVYSRGCDQNIVGNPICSIEKVLDCIIIFFVI